MRIFLLAYVAFVFLGPILTGGGAWSWALAALSILPFLGLYVAAWRAIDAHRDRRALMLTVVMAIYGLVLIPTNVGGNTYVIYSAAQAPFLLPPRAALAYLAALIVSVAMVALLIPEAGRLWLIVPTTVLIIMVGGGNVFYAESKRRDALLWRAQEEVEEMATLAERERISRDLHDILGHTLSVIALKSELASRLADRDPARAAEEIREVERVSREALSEVRSAVEGYRGTGLQGELRSAGRVLESSGVSLEMTIAAAPAPMPPRQESVMALALREAVTNIVRHARAQRCWISVLEQEGARVLTVRDDGIGVGMGRVAREGHGLTGMRERVAAAGGTVTIDGSQGMIVTVSLPEAHGATPPGESS
jgi:two-component system sensor histidine kinase DesK